jgi:hypothetical protein
MFDGDLADKLKISKSTVRRYRAEADIPCYGETNPEALRRGLSKEKAAAIFKDLGKMSDVEVAIKHGVSKPCIQGRRSRAGIPPFIAPLAKRARNATPKETIERGYSSLCVEGYWKENREIDELMQKWSRPCAG